MIVDVIDMSTTLESALDAGAYAVLGSSPDHTTAPVGSTGTGGQRAGPFSLRMRRRDYPGG